MLNKFDININNCVAQTYDGANVMWRHLNGVQALLKKEVLKSLHTHCTNHRINFYLVLVDVTQKYRRSRFIF